MQWETLSHVPYHVTLIAAQKKPLDDASAELADSTYDAALQSPKREEVREEGIRHAILPNGRPTHPSIHPSMHHEQSRTNERTEKSHAKCPKRSESKIVKKTKKEDQTWLAQQKLLQIDHQICWPP